MTAPNLAFSTPNGRFYRHPKSKAEVPSITNIIGMKDKPALKYWAAKMAATYAAQNVELLAKMKTEQERIDIIKGAPFRKTDTAAGTGDAVHDFIDGYAKNFIATNGNRDWEPPGLAEANLTSRRMWHQFKYIDQHYQIKWLVSEFTIWSDTHQYAGTGDWIAQVGDSVVYGDTKTGNGVYSEVGMQVAAGAKADYALDGTGESYQLPKADRYAVLHVRPTYTRLSPLEHIDECFQSFLGLRAVFDWQCKWADYVIQDAPQIKALTHSELQEVSERRAKVP